MTEQEIIRYVSDGFVQAKNGDAISVYDTVARYHDSGMLPKKSHYAFGWIIYYALHSAADYEIEQRKRMLARYLKLEVTKPHKLHSMILTEAIRLYRNAKETSFNRGRAVATAFSLAGFAGLWGLEYLRPGDWRRKEYEGKTLGSTVEKFITLYVDELEEKRQLPSDAFMEIMNRALKEYPDSYNLLSQRATLHILANEREEAACLLRTALLAAPGKFFLWSRLASLVSPKDNMRLYVSLLYRALRAPGADQFKGKIRIALAEAWVECSSLQYAQWELQKVRHVYEANGWHLPRAFTSVQARIPDGTPAEDPTVIYRKVEHLADEEIYRSLPEIKVVKTYHKNPKPDERNSRYGMPAVAWRVTDGEGRNYWMQPHRFRIPADLPLGTRLAIRIHNNRPVAACLLADA